MCTLTVHSACACSHTGAHSSRVHTHAHTHGHTTRQCTCMSHIGTHGPHVHVHAHTHAGTGTRSPHVHAHAHTRSTHAHFVASGCRSGPSRVGSPSGWAGDRAGAGGPGGGGAVPSVPGRQPARQPQPVPKELWAGPARTSPGSGWTPSQPQGPRPGAQPGRLSASWTGKQVLGLPGPPALSLLHLCVLMWPCQQGAGPVPHVRLPFTTGCKWGLNY